MEVADVMMIEEREVIFFTQGGDYVAPLLADEEGGEGGGSSSGLPAVVGAYRVRDHFVDDCCNDGIKFITRRQRRQRQGASDAIASGRATGRQLNGDGSVGTWCRWGGVYLRFGSESEGV